jgi:hypothetical protein
VIDWWLGGVAAYAIVAVLVALGMWAPDPSDRPGGGRLACVAAGVLWPLLGVLLIAVVAFEGIETLVQIIRRMAQNDTGRRKGPS